jgi:hypothetical protein
MNDASQKVLQDAFQEYLKANFVQIPKLVKTTTTTGMKAKLEKAGLLVTLQPQKLGTPSGTLYSSFPLPGWHVRPKSTVILYVTGKAGDTGH